MTRSTQPTAYAADVPIQSPDEDLFERTPYASRLAETICDHTDPACLVVGVYGAWGEGKSSLINLVKNEVQQRDGSIKVIDFNPWELGEHVRLVYALFEELASKVDESLLTGAEKLGEVLKTLKVAATVPLVRLEVEGAGSTPTVDIAKLKKRIQDILREKKTRLLVVLDDIDRLDKSEIYEIFRLVKATADLDYVTYLLAFDDNMVAASLEDRYSGQGGGRAFVDKIVQVPLRLPSLSSTALFDLLVDLVEGLVEEFPLCPAVAPNDLARALRAVAPCLSTPRTVVRLINSLRFSVPLLGRTLNIGDLALIESLRLFYPEIYAAVREHRPCDRPEQSTTADSSRENFRSLASLRLEELPSQNRRGAEEILATLFPGWADEEKNGQEPPKDSLAHPQSLEMYFRFAADDGAVTESTVTALINVALNRTEDTVSTRVRSLAVGSNAELLLERISARSKRVPALQARRLAVGLARNGCCFSNQGMLVQVLWNLSTSGLSEADPNNKAKAKAMDLTVLQNCDSISLGYFYYQRARGRSMSEEQRQRDDRIMRSVLYQKVEQTRTPLHQSDPDLAKTLYAMWGTDNDQELRRYVARAVKSCPLRARDLLGVYIAPGDSLRPKNGRAFSEEELKSVFLKQRFTDIIAAVNPVTLVVLAKRAISLMGRKAVPECDQFVFLYQGYGKNTGKNLVKRARSARHPKVEIRNGKEFLKKERHWRYSPRRVHLPIEATKRVTKLILPHHPCLMICGAECLTKCSDFIQPIAGHSTTP